MKKYAGVNNGRVEAAINMLGGMNGVSLLLSGKIAVVWKVWKTIKLGMGLKHIQDFAANPRKFGCRLSENALSILSKPALKVGEGETEIELVLVSVADLGFESGATDPDIYKRASELGLDLCPSEVGPQLRLQYMDQPVGQSIKVAMEPVEVSGTFGGHCVFGVTSDYGLLFLKTYTVTAGPLNGSDTLWVFARRK